MKRRLFNLLFDALVKFFIEFGNFILNSSILIIFSFSFLRFFSLAVEIYFFKSTIPLVNHIKLSNSRYNNISIKYFRFVVKLGNQCLYLYRAQFIHSSFHLFSVDFDMFSFTLHRSPYFCKVNSLFFVLLNSFIHAIWILESFFSQMNVIERKSLCFCVYVCVYTIHRYMVSLSQFDLCRFNEWCKR